MYMVLRHQLSSYVPSAPPPSAGHEEHARNTVLLYSRVVPNVPAVLDSHASSKFINGTRTYRGNNFTVWLVFNLVTRDDCHNNQLEIIMTTSPETKSDRHWGLCNLIHKVLFGTTILRRCGSRVCEIRCTY